MSPEGRSEGAATEGEAAFALDVSALARPYSSYARVVRLVREAADAVGLAVEPWEGGPCASRVLWEPEPRVPAGAPERLLVTVHDVNPLLPDGRPAWKRWWRARRYRAEVERAMERAWRIVTPSHDARERIREAFPGLRRDVFVVPWFPDRAFRPDPEPGDEAVLAGRSLEPGYLLFLAALRRHKNWQAAVRAYAALPEELRRRHALVLAGSVRRAGREPEALARRLGVADRVRVLGTVPDEHQPALYRGAGVFLFPSRMEGFGLPPLEAQACGVPVVSSRNTSLPEVLGEGATFVDPDDTGALAAATERLLADRGERARAREAALANAARFTPEATGRAIRMALAN